ncbi:mCG148169 [Mus musculus]|nr:mCG148169 [Mus musculus]
MRDISPPIQPKVGCTTFPNVTPTTAGRTPEMPSTSVLLSTLTPSCRGVLFVLFFVFFVFLQELTKFFVHSLRSWLSEPWSCWCGTLVFFLPSWAPRHPKEKTPCSDT